MLSLRQKRQTYQALLALLQQSDSISIPLDSDLSKTPILERISIVLTGHAVQLQMLMEQLNSEILFDTEQAALDTQFQRLYEEEQGRFQQPKPEPPPYDEDDEDTP